MKYTKSLKFKMALWYSGLLLLFSVLFLLVMNILLSGYLRQEFTELPFMFRGNPVRREVTEERLEIIMESRLEDIKDIRVISLYSLIPFTLLSFAGGYLIADRTLKPLEKLNKEMRSKSEKNLGKPISFVDNEDEISDLIKSFNRMSKELGKSFDSQKSFVENASHELKTPLAIIQANIDTILEDGSVSREELTSMLEESRKSITFMNRLTEDLLLLSLVGAKFEKESIGFLSLLEEIKSDIERLDIANGFKIEVSGSKGVTAVGNRVLIKRAIYNVVENSIKYSGGSKVSLDLKEEDGNVVLTISDNGKGISKSAQRSIFDRFYRVERSRSRRLGGSGLGLAITKEIIEKHGGTVRYIDNSKGASFEIVLS